MELTVANILKKVVNIWAKFYLCNILIC